MRERASITLQRKNQNTFLLFLHSVHCLSGLCSFAGTFLNIPDLMKFELSSSSFHLVVVVALFQLHAISLVRPMGARAEQQCHAGEKRKLRIRQLSPPKSIILYTKSMCKNRQLNSRCRKNLSANGEFYSTLPLSYGREICMERVETEKERRRRKTSMRKRRKRGPFSH